MSAFVPSVCPLNDLRLQDALHSLSLIEIFMLMSAGYVFDSLVRIVLSCSCFSLFLTHSSQNVEAYSGSNDVIISICLIFVCIAFFVAFLWTALGTLFSMAVVRMLPC